VHISDGILPPAVWIGGDIVAGATLVVVLSRFREDDLPRTAVLSSLLFAASAIAVPLPVGSAHLLLCGLLGIVLGWKSIPAVFTALLLQLLILGYGGVLSLGVNTLTLSAGAICAHYVYRASGVLGDCLRMRAPKRYVLAGGAAGVIGTLASSAVYLAALLSAGEGLRQAARYAFLAQLPVLALESVITAFAVGFLGRVQPALLGRRPIC
jgi:cobalt/nickel transport system permease protein